MKSFYQENIPLYYQIQSFLRHRIESGELPPNTKLPPERELCRANNVSQGTLRKAFETLENDGLIVRMVGKGTFVAKRRETSMFPPVEMRLIGFVDDLILHGKKAEVKILALSDVPATQEIANLLGVKEGSEISVFKRLKSVNGLPLYYVVNYMPALIGKRITEADLRERTPLEILERKFRKTIEYIEQRIEATKANQEVAQLLELNIFEPILSIRLAVYEKERKPLEVVDMFCRGDRYRFTAELRKRRSFKSNLVSREG